MEEALQPTPAANSRTLDAGQDVMASVRTTGCAGPSYRLVWTNMGRGASRVRRNNGKLLHLSTFSFLACVTPDGIDMRDE